jgi:hypothetical protein
MSVIEGYCGLTGPLNNKKPKRKSKRSKSLLFAYTIVIPDSPNNRRAECALMDHDPIKVAQAEEFFADYIGRAYVQQWKTHLKETWDGI